jgi:hypothetical protein
VIIGRHAGLRGGQGVRPKIADSIAP